MSVLLTHLCSFFVNDFSTTRGPIHAKFCMRAYSRSECVFSPFGGWRGGRKKGQMKFLLLWESMGNFCILAVFERYLSNACTDPHQILFVLGQCLPTCPLPCGAHRPLGAGGRELKTQKILGGLIRAADSYHFYFSQRCHMWSNMWGTDLHRFWCRTVKIGQGVSTG